MIRKIPGTSICVVGRDQNLDIFPNLFPSSSSLAQFRQTVYFRRKERETMETNPIQQTSLAGNGAGTMRLGCCQRFCAEMSLNMFQEEEADGRVLDLERSFCMKESSITTTTTTNSQVHAIIMKIILLLVSFLSLVFGWRIAETPSFYLAFLTQWALVYAVFYQTCSLLISILDSPPRWLRNLVRVFFSVAATSCSNALPEEISITRSIFVNLATP